MMLILTRRKKQTVVLTLGEIQATLTILDTRSGWCRIGVEAPREVVVIRGELLDREQPEPPPAAA